MKKRIVLLCAAPLVLCALLSACRKPLPTLPDYPSSQGAGGSVVSFLPPSEANSGTLPSQQISPSQTPLADPSASPSQSGDPVTPVSPTPTPTPTPSAPKYPVLTTEGSFRSDSGTELNLSADYTLRTVADGEYEVTVSVYLESYSLSCSARTNCNEVTLGDKTVVFSSLPIAIDAGTGKHRTLLTEVTERYTAQTLPEELYIGASWLFHGSYSKVRIDTLEAKGTLRTGIRG